MRKTIISLIMLTIAANMAAQDFLNNSWVVGEVLKQADHPAKGTRQSGTASIWDGKEDDDYRILIDKKNGYVDLESETDINQMMACVWRKANGHRIFAVSLYEQHEMPQNLLCWYDYDPATQMMKPERSPLDDFKPVSPGATVTWDLPMKGSIIGTGSSSKGVKRRCPTSSICPVWVIPMPNMHATASTYGRTTPSLT